MSEPRVTPLTADEWGEAEYFAFGRLLGVPGDKGRTSRSPSTRSRACPGVGLDRALGIAGLEEFVST